ncbi:hypothetical protein HCH_04534 [Hahella chejuensis KCTC 2396]|uniref:Uncharacterized protein n=1 Tax=Hahella chejuensis (strain KCTC 2396) TaxID=349521 RepID=Q2SDP0_HAHCH|nr:hypothetical protein HCH_04534 [Hahella chejuensis KCTC 2396]
MIALSLVMLRQGAERGSLAFSLFLGGVKAAFNHQAYLSASKSAYF